MPSLFTLRLSLPQAGAVTLSSLPPQLTLDLVRKSSVRHLCLSNLNYFNFRHCSFVSENLYKLLFEILKELTYGCFKKCLFIMFIIYHLTFSQLSVTHVRFLLVLLIDIF